MNKLLALLVAGVALTVAPAYADEAARLKLSEAIVRVQLEEAKPQLDEANATIQAKIEAETDADKKAMLRKVFGRKMFTPEDIDFIATQLSQSMAAKFTEDELKQILAFLDSPAGHKFDDVQDDMKKEMPALIMQVIGRKMTAAGQSMKK